jgi:hypothetical protein
MCVIRNRSVTCGVAVCNPCMSRCRPLEGFARRPGVGRGTGPRVRSQCSPRFRARGLERLLARPDAVGLPRRPACPALAQEAYPCQSADKQGAKHTGRQRPRRPGRRGRRLAVHRLRYAGRSRTRRQAASGLRPVGVPSCYEVSDRTARTSRIFHQISVSLSTRCIRFASHTRLPEATASSNVARIRSNSACSRVR